MARLVTSTDCTTSIVPPTIVVVLRTCEKPPYCEPIEPIFTAPVPAASSPNTTRFQPGWIAVRSASVMLSPAGIPGGEAIVRARDVVRGWITSVASVAARSAPRLAVVKLIWSVVKVTSPSPAAPVVVKSAMACTSVVLVIAADPTETSPMKRVVPVEFVIVSVPPTVSMPANVTPVAEVIVRSPPTVTLPEKVTIVAWSITRSPSMVTVEPTVNAPALVTRRSPVRETICWRLIGWAVALVSVRSSSRWMPPIPPVTVMKLSAVIVRSSFDWPGVPSIRPLLLPKIWTWPLVF